MSVRDDVDRGMERLLATLRGAWAAGTPRIGWKIGINDPAVQKRLGLDAAIVGVLHADRVVGSGGTRTVRAGAKLAAEAEIAVTIGRDVDGNVSLDGARTAIVAVAPAIELVDYAQPTPADLLGHNIFHDAVVFGAEHDPAIVVSLGSEWPILRRNGEVARLPEPSLATGDVATIVRHVAVTLARHSERLTAGERIICGSCVQPLPVAAGDSLEADFGPLGFARVAIAPRTS
jgi:2-keto-4-pentenoate hydratase